MKVQRRGNTKTVTIKMKLCLKLFKIKAGLLLNCDLMSEKI